MDLSIKLMGAMPSKKNAWKRAADGRVYIPEEMRKELDDFLWQLKPIFGRYPKDKSYPFPLIGPITVTVTFMMDRRDTKAKELDLDNMVTTLLDILQSAQIIKNDKDVVRIMAAKEWHDAQPLCMVDIWVPETLPTPPVKARQLRTLDEEGVDK